MTIPAKLHELVERFEREHAAYRSGEYNEAQVRIEFINPLFDELLGWDIENRRGRPVAYRDVVYEARVKIGSYTKALDYGFYIAGVRKFFLEAKKPSVDIQGDVNPAVQLRRYAWSAKLPLSILTDFEELAVYDCRFKPNKDDRPSVARLNFFTYDQYVERWEELAGLFSREAVLGGSLEKYAEEDRRRRGTETVDAAFLREIESWRDVLARNLALRNDLNVRQLNFAVQMTIDRIIFLRMAEDRGIEDYGRTGRCSMLTKIRRTQEGRGGSNLRFEYYPDTDSLYIVLNPGRKRKPGGAQEVVGWGDRDVVIDVDGDGVPVGIDIDSFASEIVDLTKLEAEGPIFGLARVGGPERRVG